MISLPIILLANALNQYTSRTVPGYASLRGEAATNATVTVNERPTFRQGSFFYGSDSADNTTSNLWKELEVYAAINPPGTNTSDVVYSSTGTVFIARTPETFTYDADGNMTSDGRFHYTWNGENRLVCASNAEVVVTYAYDHRGRMVTKTLCSSAPLRLIKSTTYLWDDWNIIREIVRKGDSVAITDNIWGLDIDGTLQGTGGVGGLLAVQRSDCAITNSAFCILHSALYLPTYDANGNVSEYVSTNGEIVAHYDYSPFGEPLVASGQLASTFTHQFSTKPYCAVTGFNEYVYRKYRPEIGRWMNRDPIEERGGFNLFSNNNQWLLTVDYLGLQDCIQETVSISAHGSRHSINKITNKYSTGDFDGRAKKTGNNRWDSAETGKELLDILEKYSQSEASGRCHCIKTLYIHSHAYGNGVSMRWDSGFSITKPKEISEMPEEDRREETIARKGEARDVADLKEAVDQCKIRFCKDAQVFFYGCWTGAEGRLAYKISYTFPELTVTGPIGTAYPVDESGKCVSSSNQKEIGMGSQPGWNRWTNGTPTRIPGPILF